MASPTSPHLQPRASRTRQVERAQYFVTLLLPADLILALSVFTAAAATAVIPWARSLEVLGGVLFVRDFADGAVNIGQSTPRGGLGPEAPRVSVPTSGSRDLPPADL